MIETRWRWENTHFSFFITFSFGESPLDIMSHSFEDVSSNHVKLPAMIFSMESIRIHSRLQLIYSSVNKLINPDEKRPMNQDNVYSPHSLYQGPGPL